MSQLTIQQAFDLALQHHQAGRLGEAEQLYRQILARQPGHIQAMHNLGQIALQAGRNDAAVDLIRRATSLGPNYAEAHNNLGNALRAQGQLDEAIAAYRRAFALNPNLPEVHNNLGNALAEKGQLEEAITAYRQAISLRPEYAEAHYNLGSALKEQGQLDEAIAAYRQAIALKPNLPEAHNNLSLALLARGDFQQGWEEYEWRWKCKGFPPPRNFAQPQWDGGPLEARTLLLHAEQGLGDAIQFIRYLPLVAQRGGRIIIECQAELQRLFQPTAGRFPVLVFGQPLPAFDLHCPLLSLPRVFGTDLTNIPKIVPYLHAADEDARRWQHRLADRSPLIKVGLVWAGNPRRKHDRNRSMKLANLAPLGRVPGVRLFSLQKGEAAAEAKTPPPGMELVDWTEELKDFADTAALIDNLDLIIAVDTAVPHLAGAMGKPVWTLLPFVPDWRWVPGREDNPWYPSMRSFRQPRIGDWDSVIARVVEALSGWIKNCP
jgi:Tfp pilus assembly protein PilF